MVKKVKKIKKYKNEKVKKTNSFKFGRNLGSFLIILLGLVFLFFAVFIPYSYITVYNENKVDIFTDQSDYKEYLENMEKKSDNTKVYKDIQIVNGRDFDLFDINFYATVINPEANKMNFSLEIKWNKNTSKLNEKESLKPIRDNKTVRAVVGVDCNWVSCDSSPSAKSLMVTNSPETDKNKTTFFLTGIPKFPQKANTWPIRVNVSAPNAYIFLTFAYDDNKVGEVHEAYILKYTFDDYYDEKLTNGAFPTK